MKIKQTIDFLVKGCTCKRGCKSKQCGCRKKGKCCGPGCECQGCTNLPIEVAEDSGNEQVYGQLHSSSDSDESSGPDDHSDSGDQSDSGSSHLEVEVVTDINDFFLGIEDIL